MHHRLLESAEAGLAAAALAAKNCAVSLSFSAAVIPASIIAYLATLDVHVVALLSAAIASACRWFWFGLSRRDGLRGMIVIPFAAFAFAAVHPPAIDYLIGKVSDSEYGLIWGFTLGMFPTFVVGFIDDFVTAWAAAKAGKEDAP